MGCDSIQRGLQCNQPNSCSTISVDKQVEQHPYLRQDEIVYKSKLLDLEHKKMWRPEPKRADFLQDIIPKFAKPEDIVLDASY